MMKRYIIFIKNVKSQRKKVFLNDQVVHDLIPFLRLFFINRPYNFQSSIPFLPCFHAFKSLEITAKDIPLSIISKFFESCVENSMIKLIDEIPN